MYITIPTATIRIIRKDCKKLTTQHITKNSEILYSPHLSGPALTSHPCQVPFRVPKENLAHSKETPELHWKELWSKAIEWSLAPFPKVPAHKTPQKWQPLVPLLAHHPTELLISQERQA